MPSRPDLYPWLAVTAALFGLVALALASAAIAGLLVQARRIRTMRGRLAVTCAQRDAAVDRAQVWETAANNIADEVRAADAVPNIWAQLADLDRLDRQIAPLYLGGISS